MKLTRGVNKGDKGDWRDTPPGYKVIRPVQKKWEVEVGQQLAVYGEYFIEVSNLAVSTEQAQAIKEAIEAVMEYVMSDVYEPAKYSKREMAAENARKAMEDK